MDNKEKKEKNIEDNKSNNNKEKKLKIIRICMLIYNIDGYVKKDCYYYGNLIISKKHRDDIDEIAEEAIQDLDEDQSDKDRSSKILTFEFSSKGLRFNQDFVLRKFSLTASKMEKYIKLKRLNQYTVNNKTIRQIRFILNKEFGDKPDLKTSMINVDSDIESDDDENNNNVEAMNGPLSENYNHDKGEIKNKESVVSMMNNGNSKEIVVEPSKVEDNKHTRKEEEFVESTILAVEKRLGIKLLKDMNFIKDDNYVIMNDKIVLKKPFAHAYGDLILGRGLVYLINGRVFYGITRLGIDEINIDFTKAKIKYL